MDSPVSEIVSFGPFRLSVTARWLEKHGMPIKLGDRALDILLVLVERAGQIVSHKELQSRVWRGLVVSPNSLRVHIAGLRRALGDGQGEARYIANIIGQGYCFVASVNHEQTPLPGKPLIPAQEKRLEVDLPPALARMVGREAIVRTIAADVIADRFVTVIGPGGIGKTTVAVSVAHALAGRFEGNVCFVDLGAVEDPDLLPDTVASNLRLTIQARDASPAIVAYLQKSRMLLVLDNCEHVIDVAARLAELIFSKAPGVHILATSREALRVEGERAYLLPALDCPPVEVAGTRADILAFPAATLFLDRARASGCNPELHDVNLRIIAAICERLDGIPLAIELAAARVGTYGLEGTARLLKRRLGLHWRGKRTALPRHQTLHALLQWSHALLAEPERVALRRLAIFVGTFSLDAAVAVASDEEASEAETIAAIDTLVAKSLLSLVTEAPGPARYRVLETTRAYALDRLDESGERDSISRRHSEYFNRLLGSTLMGRLEPCLEDRGVGNLEHLGNIRAALEWSFKDCGPVGGATTTPGRRRSPQARPEAPGRASLAVELSAASAPALLDFSLLNECYTWSSAGLALLDDRMRGGEQEMVLQEALAISSMWTQGNRGEVRPAILRGLEIANRLGATAHRLRLMTGLHVHLVRTGEFEEASVVAHELDAVARSTADSSCMAMSNWMLGSAYHFLGDQRAARRHLEAGFACGGARNAQQFGLDYRVRALVILARVLWLSGCADRAVDVAREAVAEAQRSGKQLNVCFSLLYTATVFIWCGKTQDAQRLVDELVANRYWDALPSFHAEERAIRGRLLVGLGKVNEGVVMLASSLDAIKAERQIVSVLFAALGLATALGIMGKVSEALAVIDDALATVPRSVETLEAAEVLRVKGELLLAQPSARISEAEECLMHALATARRQSALGWELRSAKSLAQLRVTQGRPEEACEILAAVRGKFDKGLAPSDLEAGDLIWRPRHESNVRPSP